MLNPFPLAYECLTDLAADYRAAAGRYDALRAAAESAVVQWRWASERLFELQLLGFKRGGHRVGRWLKKMPAENPDRCEYGIDGQGRIVVEREAIWGSDAHKVESFVTYSPTAAESVQFGSMTHKPIEKLCRQSIRDGVVREYRWYAPHQCGVDLYYYEAGLLHLIDSLWSNQPHREEDMLSAVWTCEYDDSSVLTLMTSEFRKMGRHPGGRFTCYRKRKS